MLSAMKQLWQRFMTFFTRKVKSAFSLAFPKTALLFITMKNIFQKTFESHVSKLFSAVTNFERLKKKKEGERTANRLERTKILKLIFLIYAVFKSSYKERNINLECQGDSWEIRFRNRTMNNAFIDEMEKNVKLSRILKYLCKFIQWRSSSFSSLLSFTAVNGKMNL